MLYSSSIFFCKVRQTSDHAIPILLHLEVAHVCMRVRAPCLEGKKTTGQLSRSARCKCETGGKACPEARLKELVPADRWPGAATATQPAAGAALVKGKSEPQAITNFKIISVDHLSSFFRLFLCFFSQINLFFYLYGR